MTTKINICVDRVQCMTCLYNGSNYSPKDPCETCDSRYSNWKLNPAILCKTMVDESRLTQLEFEVEQLKRLIIHGESDATNV